MIYIGDTQIAGMYVGADGVLSVCLGDNLVWSETSPGQIFALRVQNKRDDGYENIVGIEKNGNPPAISLEYSLDEGNTWTQWDISEDIRLSGDPTLAGNGGVAYIRATSVNPQFSTSVNDYYRFKPTTWLSRSGPIASLYTKNKEDASDIPQYEFVNIMKDLGSGGASNVDVSLEGIKRIREYSFASAFAKTSDSTAKYTVSHLENDLSIGDYGLTQAFKRSNYGSENLSLSGLHLSGGAFSWTFEGNPNLRSVRLSVEDVKYPHNNGGTMESMFSFCSALEDAEISCNPQEMSFTNGYEMIGIFQSCPNLKSVVVRGLSSVGNGTGTLQAAFQNCNSISSVSFPDLVKPYGTYWFGGEYAFLNAFNSVSSMKELRFGAGSEGDVTRLNGWGSTFGMDSYGREHCSVYCGHHMIKPYDAWEWPDNPLSTSALRFVGVNDNSYVQLTANGTPDVTPALEVSRDAQNWEPLAVNTQYQLSSLGQLWVRASQKNDAFSKDAANYWTFDISSTLVDGSIGSLVDPDPQAVVSVGDNYFIKLLQNGKGSNFYDVSFENISGYGKTAASDMFSPNTPASDGFSVKFRSEGISTDTGAFSGFAYNIGSGSWKRQNEWSLNHLSVKGSDFQYAFKNMRIGTLSVGVDYIDANSSSSFRGAFRDSEIDNIHISINTPTYQLANSGMMPDMFDNLNSSNSTSASIWVHTPRLQNKQLEYFPGENAKVTALYFEDLVSAQESAFYNMLSNNNYLSVISCDREEVSSYLTASYGWDTLWGAPNPDRLSVWAGSICLHSPPPPWSPDTYIYKTSETKVNFPLFTFEGNSGYPEFRAELCGDAYGNCYFGWQGDDNADYRFFNVGTTYYMDAGANRTNSSGPNIQNNWGLVSAWNCGWQISTETAGTGYQDGTPTTDTLSGVVHLGGPETNRKFAIGRLSVLENGALTHLYVPINDTTNGAGLSDTVDGTTHFPVTQGVWDYVET